MALDGFFRPTLLVGVGGTGCRIAERILGDARRNDPTLGDRIGILAFDTDKNDLQELENVEKRSQICFSRPETVYSLLGRNPGVENSWAYPKDELPHAIKGMTLIEGAGQVRMLTRLALHDAFSNGNLMTSIEDAISRLGVHAADQRFSGAVHVLLVGSLAGATGSGSFAQVALAVRRAAESRRVQATVRGLFLLPDIYARGGTMPATQIPNVLANGYASLKELNAFNVYASLPGRGASFTFEYAPGNSLLPDEMPFEAVSLIDFENSTGGSMGKGLDSYIQMAARAGYLMIFSPLGARYGSVTINDVRQKISAINAGAHNLYSGIGIAAVNYPVESMKTYLTKRLIHEAIKGDWTRLDNAFLQAMKRYVAQRDAGRVGDEEPDIRKIYVRDLEQLAKVERVPFFRQIHSYLFPEVENDQTFEREVKPRHLAYIDALVDHTRHSFWSSSDMAEVQERAMIDSSSISQASDVMDTVRRTEGQLDKDFRSLDAALQGRPDDIYDNIVITADGLAANEFRPHHIQNYLITDSPHPVAVRAFLYHVRTELAERRAKLDLPAMRRDFFKISNRFRGTDEDQSKPTSRGTPSVMKAADAYGSTNFLTGMFSDAKEFPEIYAAYFNQTIERMHAYANSVLDARIYDAALAECDELIRVFTGLFTEIGEISGTLARDLETEKTRYDSRSSSFDGNAWVYADGDCKEDAWSRLSDVAAGLKVDDEVNQRLVSEVYAKYRKDRMARKASSFKELNELFWEQVVNRYGRTAVEGDFTSVFDFTVVEAMRRQFEIEDRAAELLPVEQRPETGLETYPRRMREIVDRVSKQSEPYLSLSNPLNDGTPIKFWTVHPQVHEDINDSGLFEDLFIVNPGDNPIVKPEFSKFELICVNLRVNVELTHLSKLHPGDDRSRTVHAKDEGRMHDEYRQMVDRMIQARRMDTTGDFTPHVDRNWHLPGALPEIFADKEEAIDDALARAFVIASTHELLIPDTSHGEPVFHYSSEGMGLPRGKAIDAGEVATGSDLFDAYQVFKTKAQLVHASVDFWEFTSNRAKGSFEGHPSYKALLNADNVLKLFDIAARRNESEERDAVLATVLEAWIQLVRELVIAQRHDLEKGRAQDLAIERYVDGIRDEVLDLIDAKIEQSETKRSFRRAFGRAYDEVFAPA